MEEKDYKKLEKMLCKELKEITDKGELSAGSLETVDKLTHALKNVYKIQMGYEGEYSGDNYSSRRGYSRGDSYGMNMDRGYSGRSYSRDDSYGGGYSGARTGQHYVRGHYSYADGMEMVEEKLNEMMNDSNMNGQDKRTLQKALDVLSR